MSDLIVVVSRVVERVANPSEYGNFCVGVVPADNEDDSVQQHARVDQLGKAESSIGCSENAYAQDGWDDFEKPGEVIVRIDRRPVEHDGEDRNESNQVASGNLFA